MSTNLNRLSRKRKLEAMSLGTSKAIFFRNRPQPKEFFHRDSSDSIPLRPRIPASMKVTKVRSFNRRLYFSKRQSTSSRRPNADSQLVSSSSADRKKGIRKSIAELPKLFTRFFRLDSKPNKSAVSSDSKCFAGDSTDLETSKSKNHWTKFMNRLARNRVPTQQPTSFVSYADSSLYPNLESSTFQLDGAPLKSTQFSDLAREESISSVNINIVPQIVRKTISESYQTRALSTLPQAIGSIQDDFSFLKYPKPDPFSPTVQSNNSRQIQKRHPSTLNADYMAGRSKYQQPTRSIIKSRLTTPSKSDPFGDTPSISVPVLEPIRVKHPSWRKIQRNYSKRVLKKQFPEPMEISSTKDVPDKFSLPPSFTALSSESYPFGDAPSMVYPVLQPVRVKVLAARIDSVSQLPFRESNRKCHPDSTPVAKNNHQASSHTFTPARILKSVQNEVPTRSQTRSWQQMSELKTGSNSASSDMDVKLCPESAPAESSHLKTHSGLSADSGDGQVFTSTMSLRSLHEKKLEMVSGSSALTSDLSSRSLTLSSSISSSSGKSLTEPMKPASKKSVTSSGRIMSSAKPEVSQYTARRKEFLQYATSSSFSSSSTIFQNSTETINSFSQKRASMSNLLLADSASSFSAGSDAGNSSDLRGTNAEDLTEFTASSSRAADKYSVSLNPNSSEDSSLVRQQSIKVKRKTRGKRRFFRKLMSAFSTTEKNEYSELNESKSELPTPGTKKSIKSKKKLKTNLKNGH